MATDDTPVTLTRADVEVLHRQYAGLARRETCPIAKGHLAAIVSIFEGILRRTPRRVEEIERRDAT